MQLSQIINIILWVLDITAVCFLIFCFVFFSMTYNNFDAPTINTYNDVIPSSSIEKFIFEFKVMFNLKDYDVTFVDDKKFSKPFSNLNNKKKKIVISKRIFNSVGYEIDYIVSRLWLSFKIKEKNKNVILYKMVTKYISKILLILIVLSFILQTCVFILFINSNNDTEQYGSFLNFLWNYKILGFGVLCFVFLFILNYYVATKVKFSIEVEYNSDIVKMINLFLDEFKFDFKAARHYSQSITMPIYYGINKGDKWFGPFVY